MEFTASTDADAGDVCAIHVTSTGTTSKLLSLSMMLKPAATFECRPLGIEAEGI